MSSYLNFYLVPKKREGMEEDPKPLCFISYSRADDIYSLFRTELNPVFIGNGDTPNYTKITAEDVYKVVEIARKHVEDARKSLEIRMEAYTKLTNLSDNNMKEAVEDYVSTQTYISECIDLVKTAESIYDWMSGLLYSDFEKEVLINID